jgi:hypothetical protein
LDRGQNTSTEQTGGKPLACYILGRVFLLEVFLAKASDKNPNQSASLQPAVLNDWIANCMYDNTSSFWIYQIDVNCLDRTLTLV